MTDLAREAGLDLPAFEKVADGLAEVGPRADGDHDHTAPVTLLGPRPPDEREA